MSSIIDDSCPVRISRKGVGMIYLPTNFLPRTEIRVMPGRSYSPNPRLQKPYVVYKRGMVVVDKFGNLVPPESAEAHTPYEEFVII